jgi:hypothetical protein
MWVSTPLCLHTYVMYECAYIMNWSSRIYMDEKNSESDSLILRCHECECVRVCMYVQMCICLVRQLAKLLNTDSCVCARVCKHVYIYVHIHEICACVHIMYQAAPICACMVPSATKKLIKIYIYIYIYIHQTVLGENKKLVKKLSEAETRLIYAAEIVAASPTRGNGAKNDQNQIQEGRGEPDHQAQNHQDVHDECVAQGDASESAMCDHDHPHDLGPQTQDTVVQESPAATEDNNGSLADVQTDVVSVRDAGSTSGVSGAGSIVDADVVNEDCQTQTQKERHSGIVSDASTGETQTQNKDAGVDESQEGNTRKKRTLRPLPSKSDAPSKS